MRIIVLGSGIIGVTTAYELALRGHQVTVLDRQPQAASECSFSNGAQLSYAHTEPWASPYLFRMLPGWVVKADSPLLLRDWFSPHFWSWTAQFLSHCREDVFKSSTKALWHLAIASKHRLAAWERQTGIHYNQSRNGTLHISSSRRDLQEQYQQAEFQKGFGCHYEYLPNKEACLIKEPALGSAMAPLVGGVWFPSDEIGDANRFALELVKHAEQKGATFQFQNMIYGLVQEAGRIIGVRTDHGVLTADAYVVATGAYSPHLLKTLGIRLPIYPLKGYSITIDITNPDAVPAMSITDHDHKVVYSRLGNQLRVAGMVEFSGYNDAIRPERIRRLKQYTRALFPHCGDIDAARPWACLRPATPDGLPVLGATSYSNVFVNTGHGSLGWTLACESASVVADAIEGHMFPENMIFSVARF